MRASVQHWQRLVAHHAVHDSDGNALTSHRKRLLVGGRRGVVHLVGRRSQARLSPCLPSRVHTNTSFAGYGLYSQERIRRTRIRRTIQRSQVMTPVDFPQ